MRSRSDTTHSLVIGFLWVACVGTYLALFDFFLFEVRGGISHPLGFPFSKPSFFGFSFLMFQLTAVVSIGLSVFVVLALTLRICPQSIRRSKFVRPAFLSTTALATFILILRLWKSQGQGFKLALLAIVLSVLVVFFFGLEKRWQRSIPGISRSSLVIASLLPFFASFIGPEIAALAPSLKKPEIRSRSTPPNILLIVLDTLRADRLSCYGNDAIRTPNVDSAAAEGLLFQNAYSSGPWTVPAHASIFTGLDTREHHADWGHTYLRDEFVTLAEHLTDTGYNTAAFTENPFVSPSTGMAQGFHRFFQTWKTPLVPRFLRRAIVETGFLKDDLQYAPRTCGVLRRWIDKRTRSEQPFFAFVNLMAAHLPRYPRQSDRSQPWSAADLETIELVNLVPERHYLREFELNKEQLSIMSGIYDEQIEYLDQHIGNLVDFLDGKGILDDTILVITSDHGENFGEHDLIEHQFCLYNSLIRVPLIVRFPRNFEPRIVSENISTKSIYTMITKMADNREFQLNERSQIESLMDTPNTPLIISEFANAVEMLKGVIGRNPPGFRFERFDRSLKCVIYGDFKYVRGSDGVEELFDFGKDPFEEHNLINVESELATSMRAMFRSYFEAETSQSPDWFMPEMDRDTEDALRALGYVQ